MIKKSELISKVQRNEENITFFENTNLDRYKIFEFLQYCNENKIEALSFGYTPNYDLCRGDFRLIVKYSINNNEYFMFIGANSYGAPPQSIGFGKLLDGYIYGVVENSTTLLSVLFIIVKNDKINDDVYRNSIYFFPTDSISKISKKITAADLNCYEAADEAAEIFKSLMNETVLKLER